MLKRVIACCFGVLVAAAAATSLAAEPQASIMIGGPSHPPVNLSMDELAGLPSTQINTAFLTERGTRTTSFEGPLLWTVLQKAGVIDPALHREQVSQSVIIVGRDGYRAVLAVGEIAPEFEGKQVILAERMDGQPLDAEHLRVVVPLDKRGGRSVRDVAPIEVTAPSLSQ
jgi:DMSO/TMAO reductase YedYZ molybdopterin-dependent catalytic subunit